jgi:hypothetical protein
MKTRWISPLLLRLAFDLAFSPVLLMVILASSLATASAPDDSSEDTAAWLSQQLQRGVQPSQILLAPPANTLQGCTITRTRLALTGATSLSLRCPAHNLPQLVLLNLPRAPVSHPPSLLSSPIAPIVRAGAALNADWRTSILHAQLPGF